MDNIISSVITDPEALLALAPEDLAGVVISQLNSVDEANQHLHPDAFCAEWGVEGYPPRYREGISRALMEAWMWLEHEGLIAPKPGGARWYFVTRRGQQMKNAAEVEAYRKGNLLPRKLLHPIIAQKAWPAFLRGDYDTAVFQAFRDVEIAVREAGRFGAEVVGVALMRSAFNSANGPLRDAALPEAEREAMAHLFAGAIGLYKNPQSHRDVSISDPAQAVELISLASHLMRIVDSRSAAIAQPI